MAKSQTTSLERESLEAHVDLCALRYEQLDTRMNNLEVKVELGGIKGLIRKLFERNNDK